MLTTRTLSSTLDRMLTLNYALDQAFADGRLRTTGRMWMPALDVAERNDAYLISLEVPGVDPKDIEISFEQNVLTVRGTKHSLIERSSSTGELRVHANERVSGSFERAIRLPEFVDSDKISAEVANGVLHVAVPKAQAAQARKIEVRTAPQSTERIQPPSTAKD
jgi:HSP20 family protein